MDSTSKQAFDLDETESCFVVENYDENEFVDDELSENIELCLDEVDKIIEQSSGTLGSINDAMEPCTGMEFKSRDDAREFYIAYGRRAGFTVRIHHNRRSRINNMVIEHNHELMSPSKVPWRGSAKSLVSEDEKDRRIRELTIELNNEKQRCKRRCAAYQEQLRMVLSYVEEHTIHLSNKVQDIVNNVKELENDMEDSDCKYV
ncbi:hypothetical protein D5086_005616 [Populus alba]|uniref:Uncharacterized protein n=1 Tax=Populus alba TaxID=43335 RepID=A0ACC4CV48_POPAL